jgi:hypothetical protein
LKSIWKAVSFCSYYWFYLSEIDNISKISNTYIHISKYRRVRKNLMKILFWTIWKKNECRRVKRIKKRKNLSKGRISALAAIVNGPEIDLKKFFSFIFWNVYLRETLIEILIFPNEFLECWNREIASLNEIHWCGNRN